MKEQIIEILRNKLKQGTNKQVIWEADIDDIADNVVKLFCQPDVVKSGCEHQPEKYGKCIKCGEQIFNKNYDNEQTVL